MFQIKRAGKWQKIDTLFVYQQMAKVYEFCTPSIYEMIINKEQIYADGYFFRYRTIK